MSSQLLDAVSAAASATIVDLRQFAADVDSGLSARQGDIVLRIRRLSELPCGLDQMKDITPDSGPIILALGETTGHSHQIADTDGVQLLEAVLAPWAVGETGPDRRTAMHTRDAGRRFIVSSHPVSVIHDEHGAITFTESFVGEPLIVEVTNQFEYTPAAIRPVFD